LDANDNYVLQYRWAAGARNVNKASVMFSLGRLFASASAWNFMSAWIIRPSGSRASVIALALVSMFGPAACTGSPTTLALRPDFEVKTLGGIAGVSIRTSLPGMTDSEFEQLVRMGMERAAPGSVLPGPVEAPFPQCRIVWHVNSGVGPGVSTLIVNIFDGSIPVAYEQEAVTNSASTATITYAIESATRKLIASYTHPDANAPSEGCRPGSGGN
jgi:hypothetical protein